MIKYEDFAKLELKIARIEKAERVAGADKLLKLTLDMGSEKRTVAAGIAEVYKPEELEGKLVPMVANLEPRTIRGIESKGMILAADCDNSPVLLHPDRDVPAGSRVR